MKEQEDLFEKYEELPQEVQDIIGRLDNGGNSYSVLIDMLAELAELGYTFDYDLGGYPFDLEKINLVV